MSINKLISIRNAILDATDLAAIDHNNFLPLFTTWAIKAEKEIGGLSAITKYKVLDICGCTAEIPCDAVIVEAAILGSHDVECGALFSNYLNTPLVNQQKAGNNFLIIDIGSVDTPSCGIVPYDIQDNKLIFSRDLNDLKITIKYRGIVEDCDGFPLVSENHIDAIAEFIRHNWLKRKRKKTNVDMAEMRDARIEWDRMCAHARAMDNALTETQRQSILDMLDDAYARQSLSQGMKTSNIGE